MYNCNRKEVGKLKKKFLGLICCLFAFGLLIPSVYARELAIAGETVNEEGEYDSLRLAAGNTVTTTAKVDGISFVAGNIVTIAGNVSYGFYAGNSITINGTIVKDAFIAGNDITIGSDAIIGRDLYVAGSKVKVNANVARDLNIGAEKIDISGIVISGDAHLDAEELIMDESTVIVGKLSYLDSAKVTGLDKASIGSVETRKVKEATVKANRMNNIYDFIVRMLAAFVVMSVLFYIMPNAKEKLTKLEIKFASIAKTTATGLAIFFIVPVVCLIALFTGILTPIALITACVYGISLYLSSLLTAYLIGMAINTKLIKNDNPYLSLLIGIVIVKVLSIVPIIGFWIEAICALHGLGLIYKFINNPKK